MAVFRDHFSGHAADYARWRPGYPDELFAWLGTLTRSRLAWDCATGNGQAAVGLAPRFERVVATDASLDQLASGVLRPGEPRSGVSRPTSPPARVSYHCAEATRSGLRTRSVDLVTVAQALHWFDLEPFHAEVRRVVRPGGVIAAWTYDLLRVDERVDAVLSRFHDGVVADYWPPQRRHVDGRYAELELDFEPIEPPSLPMLRQWTLPQLLAYVGTWSAVRRFESSRGYDPIPELAAAVEPVWGPAERRREVHWHLTVLAGRVG